MRPLELPRPEYPALACGGSTRWLRELLLVKLVPISRPLCEGRGWYTMGVIPERLDGEA